MKIARTKRRNNRINKILSAPDKGTSKAQGPNGALARLFRKMMHDLNINGPRFGMLMQEYVQHAQRGALSKKGQTSLRGNLTKEFARDQMTWKVFCKAMKFLQFRKFMIVIEAHHRNGKRTIHSIDQMLEGLTNGLSFEELLEQPEHMEARGEHVPVLDHERDLEELIAPHRQTAAEPNPEFEEPDPEPDPRPQLSSMYWYIWSPKTLLIYETVGYLHPLKWHGALFERAKRMKVEKWAAVEPTVRMVRGDAITEAVAYYNDESKKPTGAAEAEDNSASAQ